MITMSPFGKDFEAGTDWGLDFSFLRDPFICLALETSLLLSCQSFVATPIPSVVRRSVAFPHF